MGVVAGLSGAVAISVVFVTTR
jgi:hypothetical protein